MPAVGVVFELGAAETLPGEAICIVGSAPELGAWDAAAGAAVRMRTHSLLYPRWTTLEPLWLELPADCGAGAGATPRAGRGCELHVEYKYLTERRAAPVHV